MGGRDKPYKALRSRIIAVATGGDQGRVLTPKAERQARELAAVIDPEQDIKAAWVLGMFHWLRYLALSAGEDHEDYMAAARYLAPVYRQDPEVVPELLRQRYERDVSPDGRAATDPVECRSEALGLVAAYKRGGQRTALIAAVLLLRAAAAATGEDDRAYASYMSDLGTALRLLSESTGNDHELAEAVAAHRAALDAAVSAGDPDIALYQYSLAMDLVTLCERRDSGLLDEAIILLREAAAAIPAGGTERGTVLAGLAMALRLQSVQSGDVGPLSEAVEISRAAVAETPPGHPDYADRQSGLGVTLTAMFERIADLALLEEGVRAHRAALAAGDAGSPGRVRHLSNLSSALIRVAEYTGQSRLLDEAIDYLRHAVAASDAPANEAGAEQAVLVGRADAAGFLSNLGLALQAQFEATGDVALLTEAADALRRAVGAVPGGNLDRAMYLSNLAVTLRMLFDVGGDTDVLNEAIEASRSALAATPSGDFRRAGYLSNMGGALQAMAERANSSELLAGAIRVHRAAADSTPADHPARAGYLSNLGLAQLTWFESTGNPRFLDESASSLRDAVATAPAGHPDRAGYCSNLGLALRAQYEQTGDAGLLTQAAASFRAAVEATPADYPDKAVWLSNLGHALQLLAARDPEAGSLAEAVRCYRDASGNTAAPALVRIWAYQQLARLASLGQASDDPLGTIEAAVGLLPQIAPGSLRHPDREHQVGRLAGLAGDAAAAAVGAGQHGRAVELLEQTRGILLADAIRARSSDVVFLAENAPELAREFDAARVSLAVRDRSPARLTDRAVASPRGPGAGAATQFAAGRIRSLMESRRAFHELVDRIRSSEGPDFLNGPRLAALGEACRGGPVVFVYTSPVRCDALVVSPGISEVRVVPLTGLTETAVYRQVNAFGSARITAAAHRVGTGEHAQAQADMLAILAWAWDTITEPVLSAVGYTETPAGTGNWPRIWWCPVGVLAYLPLHAAGHHADLAAADPALAASPRTVLDRVISSYAITLRSLAYARNCQPADTTGSTVIVAVPDAPDTQLLPGADAEADDLSRQVPGAQVLADPTHDSVLAALPRHAVAHFACHGYADMADPNASKLFLRDHQSHPLTIADISASHLQASLCYLSACDTSVAPQELADEAIHLTGAFHLAGYEHVIGTLWPVSDTAARTLAVSVYNQLTRGGTSTPDTSLAASSLHQAIRDLRARRPDAPLYWAAHIHTGT
jgi:tetratricopeptide (TPR) repeat protein